jgi:hypothetical protein
VGRSTGSHHDLRWTRGSGRRSPTAVAGWCPHTMGAMTLVMTAITRQTVVQLADMRLTNIRTGKAVDEETAKLIAYLGRFSFAFTGPACINRTPSAEWIASVLSKITDPEEAPTALAHAADRALVRYEPALRRYAVVGGGWLGPAARPRSVYVEVSNWDAELGGLMARSRVTVRELAPGEKLALFWAGVPVDAAVRSETQNLLRRRAGLTNERPADFLAVMVRAARVVALKHPTVGRRHFLLSSIPGIDRRDGRSPIATTVSMPSPAAGPDFRLPVFMQVGRNGSNTRMILPELAATEVASAQATVTLDDGAHPALRNPCR